MIYFTSDLHLGHGNCINLCSRPFDGLAQMDEALISNWNARVNNSDTVYIVGDLIWESADPIGYLKRLNGRKFLIAGNHDIKWLKKSGMARVDAAGNVEFRDFAEYFINIAQYVQTKINNITVTLCHYPMYEWKASRKLGSVKKLGYHIYGHIHNSTDEKYAPLFVLPHALNAGADVNGFAPVTFDELVSNNEAFKLKALESPVDKARFLAAKYHMYQTDRSGKPYVTHPTTVAGMVEGQTEKCVAFLHDVLEDTDISVKLLEDNFSAEVVAAVKAMTHAPDTDYFDYIKTVAKNPIARKVKLADLTHNMDMSRLKTVTDRDLARLEKYKKAYEYLTELDNK